MKKAGEKMSEFTAPAFLDNQGAEEIMERMVGSLPDDIDVSEGSHPYNLLMPTAVEKEMFVNFILREAVKLIFPRYCEGYDAIADYHAETNGLSRKEAFYAVGEVTVTGDAGTVIPAGTVFSTASVNETPSMEFVAAGEAVIGTDGTCKVKIQCAEPGTEGNVARETIIFSDGSIDGIASVINEKPVTGGVDEESTESLIERIVEYERNQGISFVGCNADYKRWAEEVDGTGSAVVIPPEDDSGLVLIVLTDMEGNPASEELCSIVYDHIMRPGDPGMRLAPINAKLSVAAPSVVSVSVSADVQTNSSYTLEMVKEGFLRNIQEYLKKVPDDKEIRYSRVYSILSRTEGVEDLRNLSLNGAAVNIPVDNNEFPSIETENISFTQVENI